MRTLIALLGVLPACDRLFDLPSLATIAADAGPDAGLGTVALIQAADRAPQQQSAIAVGVPFDAPQTGGDLNIVMIGWAMTSGIGSVTDTAGNLYQQAVPLQSADAWGSAIYYAENIGGGPTTVNVTFTGQTSFPDIRILEYNGLVDTKALDGGGGMPGSGTMLRSGAVQTVHAHDLLVAATTVRYGTVSVGGGFTTQIATTPNSSIAADREVFTAGSYEAFSVQDMDGPWTIQLAAFKAR